MSTITGGGGVGSFSTTTTSGNTTAGEAVVLQQELLNHHHFHGSNSSNSLHHQITINGTASATHQQPPPAAKKKRNLPGTPDPSAEVIALSPKTLMATNRFVCEICKKGFQRDQNLQLHRRGHNLPWKLKQRSSTEIRKRVYVCPEPSCVHHEPSRALGDLTGIKKHFCRKHGEKKWKCDKCSKKYAVHSDWKAHSKTCGTKEYKCDCGTIFSRRDSFITHRAFCDTIAAGGENKPSIILQGRQGILMTSNNMGQQQQQQQQQEGSGGQLAPGGGGLMFPASMPMSDSTEPAASRRTGSSINDTSDHYSFDHFETKNPNNLSLVPPPPPPPPPLPPPPQVPASSSNMLLSPSSATSSASSTALFHNHHHHHHAAGSQQVLLPSAMSTEHFSATELLQKAAQMGATMSTNDSSNGGSMHMAPSTYGGDFPRYVIGNNNQFMVPHKEGNNIIPAVQQMSPSSQFFGDGNGSMGRFSRLVLEQSNNGVLMNSNSMKNMDQQSVDDVNGRNIDNNASNNGKNVSSGGGDTMTVDFLGIGRGGGGGGGGNKPAEMLHCHHPQRQVLVHDDHDEQQREISKVQEEEDDDLDFGWSWG